MPTSQPARKHLREDAGRSVLMAAQLIALNAALDGGDAPQAAGLIADLSLELKKNGSPLPWSPPARQPRAA